MCTKSALRALEYHLINRDHLDEIISIDLDQEQIHSFLDPLDTIIQRIRRGPYHRAIMIRDENGNAGFFVYAPDPKDQSCWWIHWFAISHTRQGRGYGKQAFKYLIQRLKKIPRCQRIRLLVSSSNNIAKNLYKKIGFFQTNKTQDECEVWESIHLLPILKVKNRISCLDTFSVSSKRMRRGKKSIFPGPFPAPVLGVVRGPPYQKGQHPSIDHPWITLQKQKNTIIINAWKPHHQNPY